MIENVSLDLCPKVVDQIQYWPLFIDKKRGNTILIGNTELDKYIKIPESKLPLISEVIGYLDGAHSIGWIEDRIQKNHGKKVDILNLYALLSKSGLIAEPKAEELFKGEFTRLSYTILNRDVRRFFGAMQGTLLRSFVPFLGISSVVILLGMIFLVQDPSVFAARRALKLGQSYLLGLPIFGLAMIFSYFIHEFSHCLFAIPYGLIARTFEIRLYLGVIPVFLMTIPGIYTIPPRQRIVIWCGGIYANLTLAGFLLVLHHYHPLSQTLDQIAAKVIVSNLLIVTRNLIPFLPTDGYFIFSTLLKKPNIRSNAFYEFKNWITFKAHKFNKFLAAYFLLSVLAIVAMLGLSVSRGVFVPAALFCVALLIPFMKNLRSWIQKKKFKED